MKVCYKLSHFLNLYFIFATTLFARSFATPEQQPSKNVSSVDAAEHRTEEGNHRGSSVAPPSAQLAGSGWRNLTTPVIPSALIASLTAQDKSELDYGDYGDSVKLFAHPKSVNHHFSPSSSILSSSKVQTGGESFGTSRSKVNFNVLYENNARSSHPYEDASDGFEVDKPAEGGASRNNEPNGKEDDDEYDYDARGDNYEDDKIINPAALDNFFDKSSPRGVGSGKAEHKATTESDYEDGEQDSDERDEIDEDVYGEGGEILPVDGAFESFGKTGAETGVKGDSALPYFLVEPQSTHVIRNKPAILKCKAANALQVRK